MLRIIEEAMRIVALRALDPKDGVNVYQMASFEAKELQQQLIQRISIELAGSPEQEKLLIQSLSSMG